jgi:hypothetical protein
MAPHSAGIVGSRRFGTNRRRKQRQWWCSSKVKVRGNRADGHHRRKGRDGKSYDEGQKEKEDEEVIRR